MPNNTEEKKWEREWNIKFFPANKNRPGYYTWRNPDPQEIEEFISEKIKEAYEKGIEDTVRKVRSELMSEIRIGNLDLSVPDSWNKGYNDCLVKTLALPSLSVKEINQ